jgi:uncharacterized membrane protein
MNEHRIHQIFEAGILLKGAHALIECLGGIALALVSTGSIANFVNAITQEELIEDPNDFICSPWRSIFRSFEEFLCILFIEPWRREAAARGRSA